MRKPTEQEIRLAKKFAHIDWDRMSIPMPWHGLTGSTQATYIAMARESKRFWKREKSRG